MLRKAVSLSCSEWCLWLPEPAQGVIAGVNKSCQAVTQPLGHAAHPRLVPPGSWGNAYSVGLGTNAESLGERRQKTVFK